MVTRCVCFRKTFEELKKIAEKYNVTTIEELQKHVVFGKNCQRCHPYVKLMLQTGKTKFAPLPLNSESDSKD